MPDEANTDDDPTTDDLFSRSIEGHRSEQATPPSNTKDEDVVESSSTSGMGEELRRRLGLTNLQWLLVVSFVLASPYPVLFYLFFTGQLTSDILLLATLVYSVIAIYVNYNI